jgi:integrase/recombinase XerD
VPSEDNSRVVSSFVDYLKVEKGLASLTVSAYTRDLGQFAAFLDKHKRSLLKARRDDVRGFIQQLFSNSVDGRSVARKLSAMRHLYRFLLLDKRIERDPTLNIPLPKQWKVLPKSLGRDEIDQMLVSGAMGHDASGVGREPLALSLRNRAMLEVFYAGALRVSEVVALKIEDVKLDMGYVLVRGKGDKERIVPVGRSAQDTLSTYLREARPALAKEKSSPLLFISRGAKKLTRQRVWQMVSAASVSSGRHASPISRPHKFIRTSRWTD